MDRFVFAVGALSLASCQGLVFGPDASAAEMEKLHRVVRSANVAAPGEAVDERVVSGLHSPDVKPSARYNLLYVHGTPGDAEGWADFLLHPVAGLPGMAVDRPGFGESDSATLATLEGQSRALAPFLDPERPTILVGHSYGGPVVLQAAVDYPDQVAGVVVMAGSVSPELENLSWYNYMAAGLDLVLPEDLTTANEEVWPLRDDLARLSLRLDEIKVPVRVVHGTDDNLVPYGNVDYLKSALTGAPSVIVDRLDGAGHAFIYQEEWMPNARGAIEGMVREDLGKSH